MTITPLKQRINGLIDTDNNRIYRKETAIYLKLKNESFSRKLGEIDTDKKTLTVNRKYETHLHRKSDSFGFNYSLLKQATLFNLVVLITNKDEVFHIPLEYILEKGDFIYFKEQGFEKQIFLKLELIKEFIK
jgi:hypothetical protein